MAGHVALCASPVIAQSTPIPWRVNLIVFLERSYTLPQIVVVIRRNWLCRRNWQISLGPKRPVCPAINVFYLPKYSGFIPLADLSPAFHRVSLVPHLRYYAGFICQLAHLAAFPYRSSERLLAEYVLAAGERPCCNRVMHVVGSRYDYTV